MPDYTYGSSDSYAPFVSPEAYQDAMMGYDGGYNYTVPTVDDTAWYDNVGTWLSDGLSTFLNTANTGGNASSLGNILTGAGGTAASLYSSKVQQDAAKEAIALQKAQYEQNQKNLAPWLASGTESLKQMSTNPNLGALPQLNLGQAPTLSQYQQVNNLPQLNTNAGQQMIGQGPQMNANAGQQGVNLAGFNYDPNNYFNSPVYQALLKSGTQALDASAAARGNFGSGNQAAELQKLGMQTGAQYMGQDYQQQLGAYGANQGAITQQAGINNAANLQNQQAYNQALQQMYANQMGMTGANNAANLQNAQFANTANQQQFQNQMLNNTTNWTNQNAGLMDQYNLNANAATQNYNADFANANQLWNRQAALAGVGQTAANQLGTFGANSATNQQSALAGGANAAGAGVQGAVNSLTRMIS